MRQVLNRSVLAAAAASGILALTGGYAHADAGTAGEASTAPVGLLPGDEVKVPVEVPVNGCGPLDLGGNNCAVGHDDPKAKPEKQPPAGQKPVAKPEKQPTPGQKPVAKPGKEQPKGGTPGRERPADELPTAEWPDAEWPTDDWMGDDWMSDEEPKDNKKDNKNKEKPCDETKPPKDKAKPKPVKPKTEMPAEVPAAKPVAEVPAEAPRAAQPPAPQPQMADTGSDELAAAGAVSVALVAGGVLMARRGRSKRT
ncbi:chaplin family protein [Streptomyces spiramyceticus]|uniref:chaplin family protein n=1 Tax=Streptomyces spiramyceticus TaxID=299717 RepID=UPI00237BE52B|nr:chaplin family protein [Streptomyces spiramyceticus]